MNPTYKPHRNNYAILREEQKQAPERETTDREAAKPKPHRDDKSLLSRMPGGPDSGGRVNQEDYAYAQVKAAHERRVQEQSMEQGSAQRAPAQERRMSIDEMRADARSAARVEVKEARLSINEMREQYAKQARAATEPVVDLARSQGIDR
jgi:hypothetical protein